MFKIKCIRSKAIVLVLLIHYSQYFCAPIICWGSVFGPCFVIQYLVSFLVLQSY